MIRAALAWWFGIREPTALKLAWVALTLLSAAAKVLLARRTRLRCFRLYLYAAALAALVMRSPVWTPVRGGRIWEGVLAVLGAAVAVEAVLVATEGVPIRWHTAAFGVAMGLLAFVTLLHASPPAYPRYDPVMWWTRIYSTLVFAAAPIGALAFLWSEREGVERWKEWHLGLLVPWFAANTVVAALWPKGVDYFTMGIVAVGLQLLAMAGWWRVNEREVRKTR